MKLRPLSPKSRIFLEREMQGDPHVSVLERRGDKVLITSIKGNYCSWVSLKGDRNWELILAH